MDTIEREELRAKLDRGEDFKLVMAFNGWRFDAIHIPGSLGVGSPAEATKLLKADDEIVVYCMSQDCAASKVLQRALVAAGYRNVRRYSEGILGWQEAGYRLEGDSTGHLVGAAVGVPAHVDPSDPSQQKSVLHQP